MKIKQRGSSISINFDNRRESAAVLRQFGATKSADHLDGMEDLADLPGMTPERITLLRKCGISTLAELRATPPGLIAGIANTSMRLVEEWLAQKAVPA